MLGELNETQIESLLKEVPVGRIGCSADGIIYILPINFVYQDNIIYGHSAEGTKIRTMRKNPEVCFQVDAINDLQNWESALCWGRFGEVTDMHEKKVVMQKLINRIMPFMKSETAQPSHGFTEDASEVGDRVELILYKIVLSKKTGRFEKDGDAVDHH